MITINSKSMQRIGYGAMVLEGYYGAIDATDALATLVHAMKRSMMIDTADAYGSGNNEKLVKQALAQAGGDAFVATKFGIVFEEGQSGGSFQTGWGFPLTINGSKAYVQRAIDNSLQRLGVDCIDLLYAHFIDPNTPLEETISAMREAVQAGKVKALGLSNCTADEIRAAHAIHPIAAVQYEYSLFRREAEKDILPAVNEIGAKLVAWSPLGAGFLTGTFDELPEGDFRHNNPKMQGDNFMSNLERLQGIKSLAAALQITPAQMALAWLLGQGENIIPIPGTRQIARIDENLEAIKHPLCADTLGQLNELAPIGAFSGDTMVPS